jgi:hypothetical protein
MASFRNVSGQPVYLHGLGEVDTNAVVEVADDRLYAYTASANFEPVGAASKAAHEQAAAAEAARVADELAARSAAHGLSPVVTDAPESDVKPKAAAKPADA